MLQNQARVLHTPDDIAKALRNASDIGVPIEPFGHTLPSADVELAYQIQELNTQHALNQGRRLVGRKIGLTATAVQQQLGVNQPDYGMLFSDMAYMHNDEISLSKLIQPKIEAEVALVLNKDMSEPDTTLPELLDAIEYALPALEIVDSRVKDWRISIVDTIADNASSALYVLGAQPVDIQNVDLEFCGMIMTRHGNELSVGCGLSCLGHPLRAALWLVRQMAVSGRPLSAGDTILTGALGPMAALDRPGRIEARIRGLGHVSANFTE